MIDIDFPMIDVQPLPAWRGTVTAWRSSRGTEGRTGYTARSIRRHRLAWSPSEAADLAGVPVRTVHAWTKEDLVAGPSFVSPPDGIVEPRWCSADVVLLRISYDLLEAGLPRSLVVRCAESVYEVWCYNPHFPLRGSSFGDHLGIGDRWLLPADHETADVQEVHYGGVLLTVNDPDNEEDGIELVEHPELRLVEYPIRSRVHELRQRAGAWWAKVGTPIDRRPPWLI